MRHTEELAQAGRVLRESRALMETANATRPKFGEPWDVDVDTHCWGYAGYEATRSDRDSDQTPVAIFGLQYRSTADDVSTTAAHPQNAQQRGNALRAVSCVNALAGIANPSAIPALIQTVLALVVTLPEGSVAQVQLKSALAAALDAEPVA